MTKILYLANIRLPTEKAHGAQIMKTCEALARAGADVTLVVPRRINPLKDDAFSYYGVTKSFFIAYVPTLDLVRFGRIGFLIETLVFSFFADIYSRRHFADIIYSRDEAVLFLTSTNRVCVWESHTGAWSFAARVIARHAKKLVAISGGLKDFYMAHGIPEQKIIVAHDGIDLADFEHVETKEAARKRLGIALDVHVVLYIGRLDGWKGIETLFKAAAFLPEGMQIVVIGGEDAQVEKFRSQYPTILFLGSCPYRELANNLAAGDALVLPNTGTNAISTHYTSPLKLFGYMAAGKPIVVSDLPSIREVLTDDSCFFVPADSPEALAKGIENALTQSIDALAKANRALVAVRNYTWTARAQNILNALAAVPQSKDDAFFNAESAVYSEKRYPESPITFTQFFFKRRLRETLAFLAPHLTSEAPCALLEIGCADGVVARAIWQKFPSSFSRLDAVDTAPEMIAAAEKLNADVPIHFSVREGNSFSGIYDCIVEIGVLNYTDTAAEFAGVAKNLSASGRYICSIAGQSSFQNLLKGNSGYRHLRSYADYEREMKKYFIIERVEAIGFFVPFLWKIPMLARVVQPVFEWLGRRVTPSLALEKLYALAPKQYD